MKHLLAFALLCGAATAVPGQKTIELYNSSFEDSPNSGKAPYNWIDCGFERESPPDVQPGQFSVTKPAEDGRTYLGLVVRDNDTWEAVGQQLDAPLVTGSTYSFSLYMARSRNYLSQSRRTGKAANYDTPAKLRIWGGDDACTLGELLAESTAVDHDDWLEYEFKLAPIKGNWSHIVLQIAYIGDDKPGFQPYNGHILVDDCSEIIPIDR